VDIAIYTRLSKASDEDDEQPEDEQATSIDRQVDDCLAYAKLKGWTVARVYREPGKSGHTGTYRPEFEELLADAEAGAVSGVLVWKLDRLSRNRRDWNRVMDLTDRGLVLASVTESLDTSTPAGRAMLDLLAMFSRMESENISMRTAAAFQAVARQGKPRIAGRRPFGRLDDRVTPHRREARILRIVACRLLAGDSVRGLVLELNRRQIRTTYGKRWGTHTLRRVLTSPGNVGDLVHRGQVVARGVLPPVLDEDIYRQVVELLAQPGRRTHTGRPRSYILTGGLARCGHPGDQTIGHAEGICGNPLVSRPEAGGWRRYICLLDGHVHLSCTADPLERHVEELALETLTGPRLARALQPGRDPAAEDLARGLAADEEALKQIRDDYYDHHLLGRGDYLAHQLTLRHRIERRRSQLARCAERRVLAELPAGDQLRQAWAAWDLERRRAVLEAVFAAVIVLPGRRGMRRLDPDRVEPIWRI
jgi:site-specific DNA recombinase